MTIERAASTNGHTHMDEERSREAMYNEPTTEDVRRRGGIPRIIASVALIVVALVIVRRMQRGEVV